MSNAPSGAAEPVEGELAFYRSHASRLTAELARLQRALPPAAAAAGGDADSDPAPWMLSSDALPPLIKAYDARIGELEQSETSASQRANAAEVALAAERESNSRLSVELESALESAVRREALAARGIRRDDGLGVVELRETKQRLDIVYRENDVLTEQVRLMTEELERLRRDKADHVDEHMDLVRQVGSLRQEMAEMEATTNRALDARDVARAELQRAAADLMEAQVSYI